MKKGKVIGKKQLVLAVMVLALGAAVWFNMKYSGGTKYLGEAQFVDNGASGETLETSGQAVDYFTASRESRAKVRAAAREEITENIKNAGGDDSKLALAAQAAATIASREVAEVNIEQLLSLKGFNESIAIIGDNDVNVVVKAGELTAAQTLQIQDIAAAQSGYSLGKIKILTVN